MPTVPTTSSSHSRTLKVADFSSREYWQQRFGHESSFEWLQPSERILPAVEAEIWSRHNGSLALLHIGSGSSDLSNHLRRLLPIRQDPVTDLDTRSLVLNVDFSPMAIELGRQREREEFRSSVDAEMRWAVVDLLDGKSFRRACEDSCGKPFDIIVEKSCTDALACGPDIEFSRSSDEKLVESAGSSLEPNALVQKIPPASVLAMNLASVAQPDATWIALSYSAERFDFLRDNGDPAAQKWTVEGVQKLSLMSSESSTVSGSGVVYRPPVYHYLYTLRRSTF